jgi:hypothetical protein
LILALCRQSFTLLMPQQGMDQSKEGYTSNARKIKALHYYHLHKHTYVDRKTKPNSFIAVLNGLYALVACLSQFNTTDLKYEKNPDKNLVYECHLAACVYFKLFLPTCVNRSLITFVFDRLEHIHFKAQSYLKSFLTDKINISNWLINLGSIKQHLTSAKTSDHLFTSYLHAKYEEILLNRLVACFIGQNAYKKIPTDSMAPDSECVTNDDDDYSFDQLKLAFVSLLKEQSNNLLLNDTRSKHQVKLTFIQFLTMLHNFKSGKLNYQLANISKCNYIMENKRSVDTSVSVLFGSEKKKIHRILILLLFCSSDFIQSLINVFNAHECLSTDAHNALNYCYHAGYLMENFAMRSKTPSQNGAKIIQVLIKISSHQALWVFFEVIYHCCGFSTRPSA